MRLTPCRMSCWSLRQRAWMSSAGVSAWSVPTTGSLWNGGGLFARPRMRRSRASRARSKQATQKGEKHAMKWITREHVKVDRVACPWLIKKFVDPDAQFYFVSPETVRFEAERLDAI